MKPVTFHVEPIEPENWVYMQRSPGNLERIDRTVNWVLEQLLLGNSDVERDDDGEVVSLILGKRAARVPPSGEEPLEQAKRAVMCLGITSVMARSREEGTEPQYGKFVHDASLLAEKSNLTGFHYAFEMVKVLERISTQTFALSAPPIHGKVPEKLIWYLGEATRAHLYGLHRASIALSRSCLEEALSTKINAANQGRQRLSDYRRENTKTGYLECLAVVYCEAEISTG
jgi:hypothetical protein